MNRGTWTFSFASAIALASCGGQSSTDGTSGVGGTGVSSGGGGASAGGNGGSASCSLTPEERGLIYQITKRSKTDANWVLAHTTSAGVSRGYGASIPTTEVYLLKSGSPEPCTVAKSGAPQCQAEKNFQVCEQLDCMAGGVLSAAAWIQPLPITVTRTNGFEVVGSTTVSAFDWVTKFTEVGPEQLEVRWNGAFDIVLDTGLSAADTLIGIAMLSGAGTTSGSVDHEIKLSSPGKVEVHFDLASPELGSVVHEGTIIGNIAGFQINWLDPCSNI